MFVFLCSVFFKHLKSYYPTFIMRVSANPYLQC